MSEKIRMTHPDLEGREIFARPAQVEVRKLSGWVESDEPTAATEQVAAPAAPAPTRAARVAPTEES